jgi:para-nitrobenzyl esterase
MRIKQSVCLLGLVLIASLSAAQAQPADKSAPPLATPPPTAAPPAERYDTTNTMVGALLDDPAAKAVLTKYIPELVDKLGDAATRTLRELQSVLTAYAPDLLTDAKLAMIDEELAKLPVKH